MSLYGLDRKFFGYTSDNGTVYQVAITTDDASAGGFGSAIDYGSLPVFPRGWKMRIQYGVNGANRTKTPVSSPGATQWVAPSTFSKHSVVFNAEGCIGEKRTAKS